MKGKIHKKSIRVAGLALALCLMTEPLVALADQEDPIVMILPTAGASSLVGSHSTEEYIMIAQEAQGALWGYTNIGIAEVESGNLNIRAVPSTDGKLVGKLPKNAACEIISTEDGWAYITSGEVEGYVNLDFLLTGPTARLRANELVETVVLVSSDGLRVRDEPNTESAVLTQVPAGEELEYIETVDGWFKVAIDSDEGYVSAEFATVVEKLNTAITMTELLYGQGVSDIRVDIVEYAKKFLGNPYKWGGTSLTKGADCSGFVLAVFKNFGVRLSRSSASQANDGTRINMSDLKPGDLVFYANSSGRINHVAIYIGGGQVIHASTPRTGIRISRYNYRSPVRAVRVLYD